MDRVVYISMLGEWQSRAKKTFDENTNKVVLVLIAESSKENITELQNLAKESGSDLVGGVFPELIVDGEFAKEGVILIEFDSNPVYLIEDSIINNDDYQLVAENISKLIDETNTETPALLLMFDAMIPNVATILENFYLELTDSVKYMGCNAGSETFQPMPVIFDKNTIYSNAMLAVVMPDQHDAVLEHGYTVPEKMITATSTQGNRVISIDWKPAFEVYSQEIKSQYGVEINKDNFYELAVHFPFGLMRMNGDLLVRIPVALDDEGALFCVGEVPENMLLTLLDAPKPGSMETVNSIQSRLSVTNSHNILTFYCAGRRMHLGESAQKELSSLSSQMPDKHIYGALSLGEIGNVEQGGYPLFHNATLVCIPW